jgi:hypothetical protein
MDYWAMGRVDANQIIAQAHYCPQLRLASTGVAWLQYGPPLTLIVLINPLGYKYLIKIKNPVKACFTGFGI